MLVKSVCVRTKHTFSAEISANGLERRLLRLLPEQISCALYTAAGSDLRL